MHGHVCAWLVVCRLGAFYCIGGLPTQFYAYNLTLMTYLLFADVQHYLICIIYTHTQYIEGVSAWGVLFIGYLPTQVFYAYKLILTCYLQTY